ncbi:MAG: hypothetical protein COV66_04885 [Nitrospinae bacterium CG11_big_fil_rev_8_21_14_0_20_45_15]|nr:MAG: hypothetical protein COV66_04885 [Nitrospinae bacterium CG11_big_fil_rev_8_21_14_0_20_45_15]
MTKTSLSSNRIVRLSLAGLLSLAVIVGWFGLSEIEELVKIDLRGELSLTVSANAEVLKMWIKERKSDSAVFVSTPSIRNTVLSLVEKTALDDGSGSSPEDLSAIKEVEKLRKILGPIIKYYDYFGFIVFDRTGLQIAGDKDSEMGTRNIMTESDFVERALKGETVVSLPFMSKSSFGDSKSSKPAMFMAAPVLDDEGEVVAVLSFSLRPEVMFTHVMDISRIGQTGETYAFNSEGLMLSESRFKEDLKNLGIIPNHPDSFSTLSVQLRVPVAPSLSKDDTKRTMSAEVAPLTRMAASAIKGESGVDVDGYKDYRGIPVVGSWIWLDKEGFGLANEVDVSEAFATLITIKKLLLAIFAFLFLLMIMALFLQFIQVRVSQSLQASQYMSHAVVTSATDMIFTFKEDGTICLFNRAAERIFLYPCSAVIGQKISLLIPAFAKIHEANFLGNFLRQSKALAIGSGLELIGLRKNNEKFEMELFLSEVIVKKERLLIGIAREITERKIAEKELRKKTIGIELLQGVAVAANESSSVEEAIRRSLEHICKTIDWPVGHIYLPKRAEIIKSKYDKFLNIEGDSLIPTTIWYLVDPEKFRAFKEATENTPLISGAGLPGRVFSSGQPEWIVDVTCDLNFPRSTGRNDLGIRTGFAFPVFMEKTIVAIIECFTTEVVERDDNLLEVLNHTGIQLSHMIERKKHEEALMLASLVYQTSKEAILVADDKNSIIAVNPAFTVQTGYKQDEVLGKDPRILSSGRHDREFFAEMWESLNTTGSWEGEIYDRRKNGEIYPKRLSITSAFKEDGSLYRRVALFYDISEKKKSEELIWKQANFDVVTGLPNRNMFYYQVNESIKMANRKKIQIGLMFLDLDHFKDINDTLGHGMGDLLLKEVAKRLALCVRDTDMVARLGGDEFTVILNNVNDTVHIERAAQSILDNLSKPFSLENEVVYLSASIGISLFPKDATDFDELLKYADQAMYRSKEAGRNRFTYFTASMQEQSQARMNIAADLRAALVKDQFWVAYQPIVELITGNISKAEALIRWQHPERGPVGPAEFIPIAEETGLINEIGNWLFLQVTNQVKEWQQLHSSAFQISVNKSPIQFCNDDPKYKGWGEQLKERNLSKNSVCVEITEGLLLDASEITNRKLLEYRDVGIQVALDDFGTGYSSLSYIQKFDIDYIKIDQSFVRNLKRDSNEMALCEAIVTMSHKLGIKTIAEGVETEEQRDLLIAAKCDYGQGFLFSKPLPAEEFEELLASTKPV